MATQRQADRLQSLLERLVRKKGEEYDPSRLYVYLSRRTIYGEVKGPWPLAYCLYEKTDKHELHIWLGTSYEVAAAWLRQEINREPEPPPSTPEEARYRELREEYRAKGYSRSMAKQFAAIDLNLPEVNVDYSQIVWDFPQIEDRDKENPDGAETRDA